MRLSLRIIADSVSLDIRPVKSAMRRLGAGPGESNGKVFPLPRFHAVVLVS